MNRRDFVKILTAVSAAFSAFSARRAIAPDTCPPSPDAEPESPWVWEISQMENCEEVIGPDGFTAAWIYRNPTIEISRTATLKTAPLVTRLHMGGNTDTAKSIARLMPGELACSFLELRKDAWLRRPTLLNYVDKHFAIIDSWVCYEA